MNTCHNTDEEAARNLCQSCGFCCNGIIFSDVKLHAGEPRAPELRLRKSRSRAAEKSGGVRVLQPCGAFDNGLCRIYASRPRFCREFECVLLKAIGAGRIEMSKGRGIIRKARKQAARVLTLLGELGEADERLALAKRFRRTVRRVEHIRLDAVCAERFGDLTVEIHRLNLLLSRFFYPGEGA